MIPNITSSNLSNTINQEETKELEITSATKVLPIALIYYWGHGRLISGIIQRTKLIEPPIRFLLTIKEIRGNVTVNFRQYESFKALL
ncbi:MAG: hypothetical protein KGY50_05040, partial [Candidatus Thermoplasmatota archaeon]|nr:hypothetical protein [Candidatus Thermoplasmatota archaeon]